MAICNIITGYAIDCRSSVGGTKNIWLTKASDVTSITESSGTITAVTMTSGTKFWLYEMEKENASFTEKETGNVENGTVFYEEELKFNIKQLSATQRNNLRILAQNRLHAIVLDKNGVYWYVGRWNGLDKVGGNLAQTGKAMGDLNGYQVNLMGKEELPMYVLTSSLITALAIAAP